MFVKPSARFYNSGMSKNSTTHGDANRLIRRQSATFLPARSDGAVDPSIVDFEALRILPSDATQRQELVERIGRRITESIMATLSPGDQALLQQPGWRGRDGEASSRILTELDQAIVDRAPSLGTHLFASPFVIDRLAQWRESEPNGPRLFTMLGKALARGALARQQGAGLHVQPWMPYFKVEAQKELKTLQQYFKTTVLPRQRSWTKENLCDQVAKIVHQSDHPFPVLLEFWTSFAKLPLTLIAKFSLGQMRPAPFIDEWVAATLNRDPESVRQDLSQIRSRRRRPTKL
jgi:hypothetical protein